MEVARVMGQRLKTGWRPRRTIMFLSWGAEEYSLCGSREFVEEYEIEMSERWVLGSLVGAGFVNLFHFRGVAYINTDVCMSGPILEPVASPTLMDILVPATKDIFSPEDETENYYDWWKTWSEDGDNFDPEVSPFVGSGSDHASFIFYAGIPVLDIMFQEDRKRYPDIGGYPAYHTGFETFDLVDKVYDANFTIFGACAQLNLRIGLELAEAELLPLKMEPYATVMEDGAKVLNDSGILQKLSDLKIDTSFFIEAIQEFRSAAEGFDHLTSGSNSLSELEIRVLNDQMRGFEKTFLLYEGE